MGAKIGARWIASPWDAGGVAHPLETRFSTTCVTMPNLAILVKPLKRN